MSQVKKKFGFDEYKVSYTVTQPDHNKRLDQFLKKHFITFSREQIKKKIEAGDISIPQKKQKLKSSTKIKSGETVYILTKRDDFESELWHGKEIELVENFETIYENDDFIVINKPAFMSTHPTGKHLFYCATVMLEHLKGQKFSSVHRLDRETSGVLVLSKKPETSKKLTQLFEDKKVKKMYLLISHKNGNQSFPFTAKERLGQVDGYIPQLFTHCFEEGAKEGKNAETEFHLIAEKNNYLITLALPKTGRQHQIRAHAAYYGFPLLGDKLYNGDPSVFTRFKDKIATDEDHELMQIPRHALHALSIFLPNPFNQVFTSSIPKDLANWASRELKLNEEELNKAIKNKAGAIWAKQ